MYDVSLGIPCKSLRILMRSLPFAVVLWVWPHDPGPRVAAALTELAAIASLNWHEPPQRVPLWHVGDDDLDVDLWILIDLLDDGPGNPKVTLRKRQKI